jgi:CHAT domain-containing protein/tetratricopeptide (TPR) repeat protein
MGEDVLAQAWAFKADCYAAWHTQPQQTRAAADAVARLASDSPHDALAALACWTDGIARLAEGQLESGLARLKEAEQAFTDIADLQHAAETRVPQMVALSFLGREAEVIAMGERALAAFVAVGDEQSAGKVEINMGTSLTRQDRHAESELVYRSAARRFAALGNHELCAMADVGVANALTWQFRSADALRSAARARAHARRGGHAILLAQGFEATGQIELNRGRWASALVALARAVRILERAGASPQRRIECETALADAYGAVNLIDEALHLYGRIIAQADSLPAPSEAAWARLQRACVLARGARHEDALREFSRALSSYVSLNSPIHAALTEVQMARVLIDTGKPAEALRSAESAADAFAKCGMRGWWLEALTVTGRAMSRLGRWDDARQRYQQVLESTADLSNVSGECRTGLGEVWLAQGDLVAARRELEWSLDRLDVERKTLATDELRGALGNEAAQAHRALIEVGVAQGNSWQLLVDLERGRARALVEGIVPLSAERASTGLPSRMRALRKSWRTAMIEADSSQLSELDERSRQLEHQLLEQHRRGQLLKGGARTKRSAWTPSVLDINELRGALGPGRIMAAMHQHGRRLITVVVNDHDAHVLETSLDELVEHISGLRLQINVMRNPALAQRHGDTLERRLRAHARALFDRLWAPVDQLAPDVDEVVVVPHGPLHDLPFALLHDGTGWLVQRRTLTVAPSASAWCLLNRRPALSSSARIVAAGASTGELAHVDRELDAIAQVFGDQAMVLRARSATAAGVRQAARTAADILHLACHARFRADNPSFSTLALSDGPLPMHELARWRLPASLVVLSACETGVSRLAPGEEAVGLVRAAMLAGARGVLATQWAVDDAATANLIVDFYRSLRAGTTPSRAIREAQCRAVTLGLHPYFWGAFSLYGAS